MTFVNARSAANHGDLRAVSMLLPGGVEVVDDPQTAGSKVVGFMSNAEAVGETQLDQPAAGLVVRARGEDCKGPPQMNVSVDGVDRFSGMVESPTWIDVPGLSFRSHPAPTASRSRSRTTATTGPAAIATCSSRGNAFLR